MYRLMDVRQRPVSDLVSTEAAVDEAMLRHPEFNGEFVKFGSLVVAAVGLSVQAGNVEPPPAFCTVLIPRLRVCEERGISRDTLGPLLQGAFQEVQTNARQPQNTLTFGYWALLAPCMLPNAFYWVLQNPDHRLALDLRTERNSLLGAFSRLGVRIDFFNWIWEPFISVS